MLIQKFIIKNKEEIGVKSKYKLISEIQGLVFISVFAFFLMGQNLLALQEIHAIEVDSSLIQSDGALTEQSLPKFLAKAYSEKKLNDEAFSKESCLKAKNIRTQGGRQTLQLFRVTSTCNPEEASYIIKEPANGRGEAQNLMAIEAFPGMKELIAPKRVEGLPSIALPLAYLSYADQGNRTHYIEIMPAAQGRVFADYIKEYRDNKSQAHEEKLSNAYKTLGKEISGFYKKFMSSDIKKLAKTILHGDLHIFNIFYDDIGNHFTLIDNESIAHYLNNPRSPSKDILELFFVPFDLNHPDFRETIKGIDLKTWTKIALKDFILGYLEPFARADHKQVLQELKEIFNGNIGWKVDPEKLKALREKEINPIFDELIDKTL